MTGPTPTPDTPQASPSAIETVTSTQAAAEAQQQSQIRSLATALTVEDPAVYAQVMKGVLTAFNTASFPPLCSIQLAGDTSATINDVRYIDSYSPVVGDTVLIVKQGSELFVLGQMTENLTQTQSGWQTPTLTTTWNANSGLMPVRYRKVFDNGSYKIQLQGRVWRNGTNTSTTLWTMPAGYIPGVQRALTVTRENLNNGSNVLQLQANAVSGDITISGHQISTAVTTDPSQHGNLTTSYYDVNHVHTTGSFGQFMGTGGNFDGTSGVKRYTGSSFLDGVVGGSSQDGGNSTVHRHTTNSATHTHTLDVETTFPGWISLDGIEYFL